MPSKRMSSACVDYVPALCTHRPSLLPIERLSEAFGLAQVVGNDDQSRKVGQTWSFRGSKSRNKVSVGEPAEGSLSSVDLFIRSPPTLCLLTYFFGESSPLKRGHWQLFFANVLFAEGLLSNTFIIIVWDFFFKKIKTFNNGSLGSGIDEERSEMR